MKPVLKWLGTNHASLVRDLADLVDKGPLRSTGQLKGTRYQVAIPGWD